MANQFNPFNHSFVKRLLHFKSFVIILAKTQKVRVRQILKS
jgi:hypothetical protein